MFDPTIKPNPWRYALAALIIIAGMALSFELLMSGLGSMGKDLIQVTVPGESSIYLPEVGEYTIFYESRSVFQGKIYSTGDEIPALEIEIANRTNGWEVVTYPPSESMSYELGGRLGRSVLAFQIDQPGEYVLSASYPQGSEGPEAVLAVGHGFFGNIISGVLTFLAVFFGSLLLGGAIIFLTFVQRREASKRAAEEERRIRGDR